MGIDGVPVADIPVVPDLPPVAVPLERQDARPCGELIDDLRVG